MARLIDLDDDKTYETTPKTTVSPHSELIQQLQDIKQKDLSSLTQDEALSLAIEATQLSMKLMQLAKTKPEKELHKENSTRLLTQAETIKKTQTWDPSNIGRILDFQPLNPVKPSALNVPLRRDAGPMSPTSISTQSRSLSFSSALSHQVAPTPTPPPPSSSVVKLRGPISSRQPTSTEQILLWRGSKLHGGPYPPWENDKIRNIDHHSFSEGAPFVDQTDFRLSTKQLQVLAGWKQPEEALPPPHMRAEHAAGPPLMEAPGPTDFVQDAATDCSVVASMCAGMARVEKGFPSLLEGILYPYHEKNKAPMLSPNGKYIVRLNFNGCFRKVQIDGRLPVTVNNRLLHIIDRNNPRLLWPALLEKAYLKIRGGYDFPGSNSGTDLWILTGWVPEQILLHHEDTDVDRTWERIHQAFNYGDVLVTIGSGKMTKKTENELGLVGEHDYAILDLKEIESGEKQILIKNPWLNGPTWRGRFGASRHDSSSSESSDSDADDDQLVNLGSGSRRKISLETTQPGSFWMSFHDALQNFESLYLNWNPGLFKYRSDSHFEWDLSQSRSPTNSLRTNPQFSIHASKDDQVWVILSRHFTDHPDVGRDEPMNMFTPYADRMSSPEECYISLYAFKNNGQRVVSMRNATLSNPFVDTPQTLLKLDVKADEPVTVVAAEQLLQSLPYNFTLSTFSQHAVRVERAKSRYHDSVSAIGQWTDETSGGNAKCPTYTRNPQYALHLPAQTHLSIILESTAEELSINVKLLHGNGQRIESELKSRDILLESGDYRRHCVVASTSPAYANNRFESPEAQQSEQLISAGNYTIAVSTFAAGQIGDFTLTVASNVNASLNAIARSGAGRILKRFSDVSFAPGVRRVGAPFVVKRLVTVYFTIKLAPRPLHNSDMNQPYNAAPPSPVRLTVENSLGPDRVMVVASGAFMDPTSAGSVRTEDCQMIPAKRANQTVAMRAGVSNSKQMWLVVERMGTDLGRGEERFQIESWADVPDWDSLGVWRDITSGI